MKKKHLYVFSILITLLSIISCSPTIKLESKAGIKKLEKGKHGVIVYSFSRNQDEQPHYTHYTSSIELVENKKRRMILIKPHLMIDPNPDLIKNGVEKYFSNDIVPIGHYNIIEFYFQSYPASYYFYTKIPFEVIENEVTYLGDFHITPFSGKNIIGSKVKAGGKYTITNQFENDSIKIYNKFDLLENYPINIDVFEEEYPILEKLEKQ